MEFENPKELISIELFSYYFGDITQGESSEVLKLCATKMIENLDQRIDNLVNAIQERDLNRIINLAHQLKGSFGTMSSPYLAALCETIEKESSHLDFAALSHKADIVKKLSHQFKTELRSFLNQL